jgi:hypothetical protein
MNQNKLSIKTEAQLVTMRKLGRFTREDVMRKLDVTLQHAQTMVNRLRRRGLVTEVGTTLTRKNNACKVFMVCDKPYLVKLPSRQKIWNTMRITRSFSKPEVCAAAEVSMGVASRYINELIRWGYVRKVSHGRPGEVGGYARYRLIRDTGPEYPRCSPMSCSDPNNNDVRRIKEDELCRG